jgi:hypothetical protein
MTRSVSNSFYSTIPPLNRQSLHLPHRWYYEVPSSLSPHHFHHDAISPLTGFRLDAIMDSLLRHSHRQRPISSFFPPHPESHTLPSAKEPPY